ncbi:MAG: DUF3987 domain-containing protein [Planctomycetota bacterium]|nr:MAG: DUF3987 domain-containing protein [Planctomycetota bacterium]
MLDGKHHPCPRCGGKDRFRLIDPDAGAVLCNQCFSKNNGDFLAAVMWMTGCDFPEAVRMVGDYLGLDDGKPDIPAKVNGKTVVPAKANGKPAGNVPIEAADALAELKARLGQPSALWPYHNAQGELVGLVVRWDKPDGTKEIRPISKHSDGWRIGAMPKPRPLYGLRELLAADPSVPVVVVEGEKTADAARQCGLMAVTSCSGSKAAKYSDWSPLAGREVIILPDHDEAGEGYADDVAKLAYEAGAVRVRILRLGDYASELPPAGDLADVLDAPDWCGLPLGEAAGPEALGRWILDTAKTLDPVPATVETKPETSEWPEILPLEAEQLPVFPTDALPANLREWVEAEAYATQTPPDLAALLALSVCSAVVARRVEIEPRPGWREPLNLFAVILLDPGNRKSKVFSDATKPLYDIEKREIEKARPVVAAAQSERRILERKLAKLEKLAGEKDDSKAQEQANELAFRLAATPEPCLPRLIVDNATPEKLGDLLAKHGGRLASMSAEGEVFEILAGRYSGNSKANFEVHLKAHAGDWLRVDRIGRDAVSVERPTLVCAYTVQPEVFRDIGKDSNFRGRGVLARFLYACPKSPVGHRIIAPPPVPPAIYERYCESIEAMERLFGTLEDGSEPAVIRLTSDAQARLIEWETEVERLLADDGELEHFRDWGGKLAGATLRLAGVMHCVERPEEDHVQSDTLARAIRIARYLIPHAIRVLGSVSAGIDARYSDAMSIVRWIRKHNQQQFSKREIHQKNRHLFPLVDDIEPVLSELERRGYIRKTKTDKHGRGRPSEVYEVNPRVFETQNPETHTQNTQKPWGNSEEPPTRGNFEVFEYGIGQFENEIAKPSEARSEATKNETAVLAGNLARETITGPLSETAREGYPDNETWK